MRIKDISEYVNIEEFGFSKVIKKIYIDIYFIYLSQLCIYFRFEAKKTSITNKKLQSWIWKKILVSQKRL